MSGLIEEIQREALDTKVSVTSLLRKVKLTAVKLGLDSLESWIEQELNGFSNEVPDYRIVIGNLVAWNPVNGWIHVQSNSHEFMETVSQAQIRQSIASLEDLLAAGSGGHMNLPLAAEGVNFINNMSNYKAARMAHQISRGDLVSIVSTVRNMVLDWTIEMEKKGVLGAGMSFAPEERALAQQVMTTINIGSVEQIVGNVGSHNTSGDISVNKIPVDALNNLIETLRTALPRLSEEGIDSESLEHIIDDIETEGSLEQPEARKLRGLLSAARTVLIGAAGSITAEGAMALIDAVLNQL